MSGGCQCPAADTAADGRQTVRPVAATATEAIEGFPVPRLSMALCPACQQQNADAARTCSACGTPLVMRCPACDAINVRTRIACHRCRTALHPATDGTMAAAGVDAGPDTEPAIVLTLLGDALDGREPAHWRDHPPRPLAGAARHWMAGADPGVLDWPQIHAEAPTMRAVEPPTSGPAALPGDRLAPTDLRASADTSMRAVHQRVKAERRAKVRQRQLRTQRDRAVPALAPPSDVLLLEPDAGSRVVVCAVLEDFGFRVHRVVGMAETLAVSLERRYAAVLLGLGAPQEDVAALCHQLRRLPAFGATPVFAIGDAARHADRVRMQLAGAQDTLMRPVSRGTLARTLHLHGIVLPRDPRVGGPPAD